MTECDVGDISLENAHTNIIYVAFENKLRQAGYIPFIQGFHFIF